MAFSNSSKAARARPTSISTTTLPTGITLRPNPGLTLNEIAVHSTRVRGDDADAVDRFQLVWNGFTQYCPLKLKSLNIDRDSTVKVLVKNGDFVLQLEEGHKVHKGKCVTKVLGQYLEEEHKVTKEKVQAMSKNGELSAMVNLSYAHNQLCDAFPKVKDAFDAACQDFDNREKMTRQFPNNPLLVLVTNSVIKLASGRKIDSFKTIFVDKLQLVFEAVSEATTPCRPGSQTPKRGLHSVASPDSRERKRAVTRYENPAQEENAARQGPSFGSGEHLAELTTCIDQLEDYEPLIFGELELDAQSSETLQRHKELYHREVDAIEYPTGYGQKNLPESLETLQDTSMMDILHAKYRNSPLASDCLAGIHQMFESSEDTSEMEVAQADIDDDFTGVSHEDHMEILTANRVAAIDINSDNLVDISHPMASGPLLSKRGSAALLAAHISPSDAIRDTSEYGTQEFAIGTAEPSTTTWQSYWDHRDANESIFGWEFEIENNIQSRPNTPFGAFRTSFTKRTEPFLPVSNRSFAQPQSMNWTPQQDRPACRVQSRALSANCGEGLITVMSTAPSEAWGSATSSRGPPGFDRDDLDILEFSYPPKLVDYASHASSLATQVGQSSSSGHNNQRPISSDRLTHATESYLLSTCGSPPKLAGYSSSSSSFATNLHSANSSVATHLHAVSGHCQTPIYSMSSNDLSVQVVPSSNGKDAFPPMIKPEPVRFHGAEAPLDPSTIPLQARKSSSSRKIVRKQS